MTATSSTSDLSLAPLPVGTLCFDCGYDLRGGTSNRCPECGRDLSPLRTGVSPIPWQNARGLARFGAYWRTVALVCLSPRTIATAIETPVHYAPARWFQFITLALTLVTLAGLEYLHRALPWHELNEPFTPTRAVFIAGLALCIPLALLTFTSLPSMLIPRRGRPAIWRARAGAISYYAVAPLAAGLLAVLVVVLLGFLLREVVEGAIGRYAVGVFSNTLYTWLVIWWCIGSAVVLALIAHSKRRGVFAAIVPLFWLLAATIVVFVFVLLSFLLREVAEGVINGYTIGVFANALYAGFGLWWWLGTASMLGLITRSQPAGFLATAILPIVWLLAAALILLVVAILPAYITLMVTNWPSA
jgi:hypothetical protein